MAHLQETQFIKTILQNKHRIQEIHSRLQELKKQTQEIRDGTDLQDFHFTTNPIQNLDNAKHRYDYLSENTLESNYQGIFLNIAASSKERVSEDLVNTMKEKIAYIDFTNIDSSKSTLSQIERNLTEIGNHLSSQLNAENADLGLTLDNVRYLNDKIYLDFGIKALNKEIDSDPKKTTFQDKNSFGQLINEQNGFYATMRAHSGRTASQICDKRLEQTLNRWFFITTPKGDLLIDAYNPKNEELIRNVVENGSDETFWALPQAIKNSSYGQKKLADLNFKAYQAFMAKLDIEQFIINPEKYKNVPGYKEKITEVISTKNEQLIKKLINNLPAQDLINAYEEIEKVNHFRITHELDEKVISTYNKNFNSNIINRLIERIIVIKNELETLDRTKCEEYFKKINSQRELTSKMVNFFKTHLNQSHLTIEEKEQFLSYYKNIYQDNNLKQRYLFRAGHNLSLYDIKEKAFDILSQISGINEKEVEYFSKFIDYYSTKTIHTDEDNQSFLNLMANISKNEEMHKFIEVKYAEYFTYIQTAIQTAQHEHLKHLGFSDKAIALSENGMLNPNFFNQKLIDSEKKEIQEEIVNLYNDLAKYQEKFDLEPSLKNLENTITQLLNQIAELNTQREAILKAVDSRLMFKNLAKELLKSCKNLIHSVTHPRDTLKNFSRAAMHLGNFIIRLPFLNELDLIDKISKELLHYDPELSKPVYETFEMIADTFKKELDKLLKCPAKQIGKLSGKLLGDYITGKVALSTLKGIANAAKTETLLLRINNVRLENWMELKPEQKIQCFNKTPHAALLMEAFEIAQCSKATELLSTKVCQEFEKFCTEKNITNYIDNSLSPQAMQRRIKMLSYHYTDPIDILDDLYELNALRKYKNLPIKCKGEYQEIVKFGDIDHMLIGETKAVIKNWVGLHSPNFEKIQKAGLIKMKKIRSLCPKTFEAEVWIGDYAQTKTFGLWSKEEHIQKAMESLQNIVADFKMPQGSKTTIKVWGYDKEGILFETMIVNNKIKSSYVCAETLEQIFKKIGKK